MNTFVTLHITLAHYMIHSTACSGFFYENSNVIKGENHVQKKSTSKTLINVISFDINFMMRQATMTYKEMKMLEMLENSPSRSMPCLCARYRTLSPTFAFTGILCPDRSINTTLMLQQKLFNLVKYYNRQTYL